MEESRAEPPVHRVAELWAIRGKRTETLVWKDEWGLVKPALKKIDIYTSEEAAREALKYEFDAPCLEVVRIVTGGADGR